MRLLVGSTASCFSKLPNNLNILFSEINDKGTPMARDQLVNLHNGPCVPRFWCMLEVMGLLQIQDSFISGSC
jgi:hypothetical protein